MVEDTLNIKGMTTVGAISVPEVDEHSEAIFAEPRLIHDAIPGIHGYGVSQGALERVSARFSRIQRALSRGQE